MSKLLTSLMRNYFPKRPSGAPLHTLSKLYDVPVGFVTSILRLCIISYLVFLRPGTVWYWVLGSIPGEAKPNPVLNPKPCTTPYRVSKRLGNEFTPPMTIPGLKVCNEFITSKTFLLEFANYKTFINNKTFVGPLTRMAGKRDVMTCALSLVWRHSNITATSSSLLLRECKIAAEMLF